MNNFELPSIVVDGGVLKPKRLDKNEFRSSIPVTYSNTSVDLFGVKENGTELDEDLDDLFSRASLRTPREIKERNNMVDELTKEFLFDSTIVIACFLIKHFENENPIEKIERKIEFEDNEEFNNYLDEIFGEFTIGDYSYTASEILFNVDYQAYKTENKAYQNIGEEE